MLKKTHDPAAVSALLVSGGGADWRRPIRRQRKADAAPVDTSQVNSSQSTDQWVFSKFKRQ